LLKDLFKLGVDFNSKPIGPLSGFSFCITGQLSKPRKYFEQIIEKYGGTNTSITSCNYLICNSPSDSSKFKKANERGIKIINEYKLLEMIQK
jgi:DNA ligase (NAD+)